MSQDISGKTLQDRWPLILANGFFPFPLPMQHLVAAYASMGFYPVAVPYRLDDMMDVVRYAHHINAVIRGLHDASGRKVDVVGVSMGGIAALYAIRCLDAARFVRTLVLAGSPIKGTPISVFGEWTPIFRRTGRQLAFDSELLRELREGQLPDGPRYVSISGFFDMICPPVAAALPGADCRTLRFMHFDLMFSPWIHLKIAKIILE